MLTTGYITAKKGPLYTVWLAANWEKKLTKANISDLNLESTIKSILAPNMQIALRTSAHLLLGVVRIYSKKAKYLLIDCSEAYVRIKSAFRPGIIDLPKESKGSAGHDPNVLPVVFSDFDIPITDILSISGAEFLEPEPHLLNNLDKITLKRTSITPRHQNGAHASDLDLTEPLALSMMEGSEVMVGRRNSGMESFSSDHVSLRLTPRPFATPDSRRDLDAPIDNDLGDADMNLGLDLQMDFDPPPGEFDHPEMELLETGNGMEEVLGEMEPSPPLPVHDKEADPPVNGLEKEIQDTTAEETRTGEYENTFMPDEGTRGTYVLQPINTTRERGKRKRKLVIDSCKVLTNKMIRTQLSDCGDTTYQNRTFPPISRRAIQCKARCADETLLTMPAVAVNQDWFPSPIIDVYNSNFTHDQFKVSYDPSSLLNATCPPPVDTSLPDLPHDVTDLPRDVLPNNSPIHFEPSIDISHDQIQPAAILNQIPSPPPMSSENDPMQPPISPIRDNMEDTTPVTANETDLLDSEIDLNLQLNEMTVDKEEEKRWNQRVQVFLKTLKTKFKEKEEISYFEDLTNSACNRKKAASLFYSCLLLAKDNTIKVRQEESYGDIIIVKGSKNKDSSFKL